MSLAAVWNIARRDVVIPKTAPKELLIQKHEEFILKYGRDRTSYEYEMSEYLRMSGLYWCLASLDVMGATSKAELDFILDFVKRNQNPDGGFAASERHDSHILHTLCAVQVLIILDKLEIVDAEKIVTYVKSLQNEDGSFSGEIDGEVDTRFSLCSLATLYFLGRLDAVDVNKAVEFVLQCYNFDGGFGTRPGSESHAGQVYCCLSTLAIAGKLDRIKIDRTGEWLAERQCPSGGLCGRPEKLPDVCYSWWVLASLAIIKRTHWIDKDSLVTFILASQDDEDGGIADQPEDVATNSFSTSTTIDQKYSPPDFNTYGNQNSSNWQFNSPSFLSPSHNGIASLNSTHYNGISQYASHLNADVDYHITTDQSVDQCWPFLKANSHDCCYNYSESSSTLTSAASSACSFASISNFGSDLRPPAFGIASTSMVKQDYCEFIKADLHQHEFEKFDFNNSTNFCFTNTNNKKKQLELSSKIKIETSKTSDNNSSTEQQRSGRRRYKTPSPQILRVRREAANARERRRMNNLNVAFDQLRTVLPEMDNGRRLSKFETLQMAQQYIDCLNQLLSVDQNSNITVKTKSELIF